MTEPNVDEIRERFHGLFASSSIVILPYASPARPEVFVSDLQMFCMPLPLYSYRHADGNDGALRVATGASHGRASINALLADPPEGVVWIEDAHRSHVVMAQKLMPKLTAWILGAPRSETADLSKLCGGNTVVLEHNEQRMLADVAKILRTRAGHLLRKKGKARWKEIQKRNGSARHVAIEVDSGDYFVGKNLQEAMDRARQAYPGKIFYFFQKMEQMPGPIQTR